MNTDEHYLLSGELFKNTIGYKFHIGTMGIFKIYNESGSYIYVLLIVFNAVIHHTSSGSSIILSPFPVWGSLRVGGHHTTVYKVTNQPFLVVPPPPGKLVNAYISWNVSILQFDLFRRLVENQLQVKSNLYPPYNLHVYNPWTMLFLITSIFKVLEGR